MSITVLTATYFDTAGCMARFIFRWRASSNASCFALLSTSSRKYLADTTFRIINPFEEILLEPF
jgi:hypothetical protein